MPGVPGDIVRSAPVGRAGCKVYPESLRSATGRAGCQVYPEASHALLL